MNILRRALEFGVQVSRHVSYRQWLAMDRDLACQTLSNLVEQSTPAELEAFERDFLNHSLAVVGQDCRLRAMELYAYLKIREMAHTNALPEFLGTSNAL